MKNMKIIFGVLLLAIAAAAGAAGPEPYGVFAGSYSSGEVESCVGNCDTDTRKRANDAMLGVGLQAGFLASEVVGYVDGQGLGANLIARLPIGQNHSVGLGGGIMRISYDVALTPTITRSAADNATVAFLEYTGRIAPLSNERGEVFLLTRIGWQKATLVAKHNDIGGIPPVITASYRAEFDESGPFVQLGILFRTK
jgi:hypothetical protein